MMVQNKSIHGLQTFKGLLFDDIRGTLFKPFSYNFPELSKNPSFTAQEVWFTKSMKNVLRGMHLQLGPMACNKIVSVIKGSVKDVVVDLRTKSPSYGVMTEQYLSHENGLVSFIPKGCAHGYLVLESDTIVMYMADQLHDSKNDTGFRYDSFDYPWNISAPIISNKDLELMAFKDFLVLWQTELNDILYKK